jgi:transposase
MQDKELYKSVLGIKEPWTVLDVILDISKKTVTIRIEYDKTQTCKCPNCGKDASRYDHNKRQWRHLDTCQLHTIIECDVPRIDCKEHGVKQIPVPWAETNSHFTALFEALVINWLKEASIIAVADLFDLTWDRVAGIQERAVERGLQRRKEKPLKNISIDETSYQKHHEYVTVIIDKDHDIVLDILDDRKAETIEKWLKSRQKRHRATIETVSMDMWDPFILAVRNSLVDADKKICFDRFHVAQYFNKAVDKVRAEEHRLLPKINGKSRLTGTKHKWLRNSNRTDNRSRRDFMMLTRSTLKTARAWAIKEVSTQLWNFSYRGAAEKAWLRLLSWIRRCRLAPVKKVGRMVKNYLWGILNAIIVQVTNATAEAKNARIQRIKNMACGFRNRNRFRMAILFHPGGLYLMPKTLENYADPL